MPAPAEIQAATLDEFIKGWEGWTPRGFLDTWSNSCTQKALPFSANVPIQTKEHMEHLFPILMSLLTDFQVRRSFMSNNSVHLKRMFHSQMSSSQSIMSFTTWRRGKRLYML